MGYLDRIRAVNRHDMSGFRPLFVAGREVGWVRHAVAERLARSPGTPGAPGAFEVGPFGVALRSSLTTPAARTAAVAAAFEELEAANLAPPRRGERYAVTAGWGEAPLFELDRAHVPVLGVPAFGVHLNGYVVDETGLRLWVAERATDRAVAPGKLDNMVAGGQPAGLGLMENLVKECAEEAGMPDELARRARPAGLVSYCLETEAGLKPDTLFVYDLEVPADFRPVNTDGEIARFTLWPVDRVLETVRDTDAFKFNVPLVILDFAIRHGVLTPEADPDYTALVLGLRRDPVRFHPDPAGLSGAGARNSPQASQG
ncbi:NUDIX hydrolase [Roseospira goensis]|uniref:Nudix hydrolase domain-containing protein n=1 Tax=Roseospira goensis TaxID=391922 RepID=A0A7W6WJ50_9PROT|nr:DUF4743 domain-containing protein [Roseospira goensis]MBB4284836.1 hypothetical protein [Roseospira goensis]